MEPKPVPKPLIAGKKLLITGAGIAGLAFPLALHKQWPTEFKSEFPTITIYERDSLETLIGREGYSISIRGDALAGGMQALHKMGLLDEMLEVSLTGRDDDDDDENAKDRGAFCLWDLDWKLLLRVKGESLETELPAAGMRIKRDALRTILIEAVGRLENVSVQWETQCLGVEVYDGETGQKVRVSLAEGRVDEGDFLIVADGARSKIRSLLRPTDTLNFARVCMISGTARFEQTPVPKPMDKDWGGVLGGNGVGLFVAVVDSKSALWALSYRSDKQRERMGAPMSQEQVQSLLQEAAELGNPFSEPLQTLIRATDPTTLIAMNAMDKAPFAHEGNSPIVFIGDSNHAMSPFAGNGANMALCDAWDLAQQLCQSRSMQEALKIYDGLSMPRSSKAINASHWAISLLHARGWKLVGYRLVLALLGLFFRL